ncbi:MAG TPA: SDR family NAD(P)-dependent oxidoreductase [bacterium]|nr:SDR family NAD(P)-dependent oxidoreductase [bacterium]
MRLENKVAIVTGAASGIGLATAERFVTEGAKVIFSDINDTVEIFIRKHPQSAFFIKCDVSDSEQVEELVAQTAGHFGRLDIMVNNAGIGTANSLLDTTDESWMKIISVNLSGVFYGMRAAANYMKEQKIKGSIINMSSILGEVGFNGAIAYCAAKGGVVQLTRAGAIDLAPYHIRVNAIAPGFIETNMTKDYLENPDFKQMVASNTPLGHTGKAEDIASAALYLASDESNYVTGDVLFVDGGWRAR